MRFVDSHLHLDGPGAGDLVRSARSSRMVLWGCGVDRLSSAAAAEFARSFPGTVKAFAGVHPSEALKERDLGWLPDALGGASGLGEVGLDPKYSEAGPGSTQMDTLAFQLDLARRLSKPVQVHCRGAERTCLDVLGTYGLKRVLMHWFEDQSSLGEVGQRGYFVSFGPALLYSKKLRRMAAEVDRSLVLSETDAPVPYRALGGASGPSLIPSVVFALSEVWGSSFAEVAGALLENSARFLGGGEKG